MTDPAVAIPVHFTFESMIIAALALLVAWAAHRRLWLIAAGLLVTAVGQILHAGWFLAGEAHAGILGLRLAGLVGVAAGLRWDLRGADPDGERSVPAAAAAGLPGLAWGTAVAGFLVAAGHARLPDRRLWAAGWGSVAAGELWLAAAGPAPRMLDGDLGIHLIRTAGALLLAGWAWRRMMSSLRIRVIGAFTLVLFVVVAVAGGAIARVGAADRELDELARLQLEASAQEGTIQRSAEDVARRAGVVSPTFSGAVDDPQRAEAVARELLEQVFPDLSAIVLVMPDRSVRATAGAADLAAEVAGSTAAGEGLAGATTSSIEPTDDALLTVGAAPVWREGRDRATDEPDAVVMVVQRFGDAALERLAERLGVRAAISRTDGTIIAASDPSSAAIVLPPEARTALAAGDTWRGSISTPTGRHLAAATAVGEPGPDGSAILVARSDEVIVATALDVSRALLGAILAAALVAVMIALWMSSRILRPVFDLTETARQVAEGDLERTAGITRTDELGVLAGAFDTMTISLRSTLAAEQDTRRELETILAGMGEGLVAMDADFNIVSFNPAAEEICGVSADEAVGRKCHDVYGHLTRGRDGKPICDYICPLRHDGGSDGGVVLETPDGAVRSLAVTCSTLRDDEGRVIGGVDLLRDVTSEMQAERMKSSFLANISHELRTPLAPILGYAQIMRRKKVPARQRDQFLEEIVSSSKRLERVVSILVDVAALEAGHLEVSPRPADPADLVRGAAARWKERLKDRDVRSTVSRGLPEVHVDEVLVGRALDEIVDNAVKFSPDGGPVTIRARKVAGGVEVSVTDKGIGISADDIERLQGEFVQADPSETRRFGGLGVGLSFVRRILEAHDASLQVAGRPGRGTTVSFVLPVHAKPGARAAKRSTAKPRRRRS